MTITNPSSNRYRQVIRPAGYGPQLGFAAATFACFAAWAGSAATLPADTVVPAVASLMFAFAAIFAAIAWTAGRTDATEVTYWDAAGAMTLLGLCTSVLIDPDQLVRIVARTP